METSHGISSVTRRMSRAQKDKDADHGAGSTLDEEEDDSSSDFGRRRSQVQSLARRYTTREHTGGAVWGNPFLDSDKESPLNPNSDHFDARAWSKAVVDMDEIGPRTSGVCFQHLNVYGYGKPTDFQKNVGNVWLDAAGAVRKVMGLEKPRQIDILRDFDGIVNRGEMLIVLGPPGAGCSTFLKTISGETNGLYIDNQSYFNYQGKSKACHQICQSPP